MTIQGTQTERNLLTAFAGESQARNRYTYFAKQAQKEGFEEIAAAFTEIATQESVHAKQFFKRLTGGKVEVRAEFPAGVIGRRRRISRRRPTASRRSGARCIPSSRGSRRTRDSRSSRSSSSRRGGREASRDPLSRVPARDRDGPRLQARISGRLALSPLRLHPHRARGAQGLPGLRASAGPLRDLPGRRLIHAGGAA